MLGPAHDGVVYLIGLRGDRGSVFSGVRWRGRSVFARLHKNAPGARVLSERLHDFDRIGDLANLLRLPELASDLRLILRYLRAATAPTARAAGTSIARQFLPLESDSRAPPVIPSI